MNGKLEIFLCFIFADNPSCDFCICIFCGRLVQGIYLFDRLCLLFLCTHKNNTSIISICPCLGKSHVLSHGEGYERIFYSMKVLIIAFIGK